MSNHVITRLRERYNLRFNRTDIDKIVFKIIKGEYIFIRRDEQNRKNIFIYVRYKNVPIKFLYNERDRFLITAYPFNYDEYDKLLGDRIKKTEEEMLKDIDECKKQNKSALEELVIDCQIPVFSDFINVYNINNEQYVLRKDLILNSYTITKSYANNILKKSADFTDLQLSSLNNRGTAIYKFIKISSLRKLLEIKIDKNDAKRIKEFLKNFKTDENEIVETDNTILNNCKNYMNSIIELVREHEQLLKKHKNLEEDYNTLIEDYDILSSNYNDLMEDLYTEQNKIKSISELISYNTKGE